MGKSNTGLITRVKFGDIMAQEIITFLKEHCKDTPYGECYMLCILSRKKNNDNMSDSQQIMRRRLVFNDSDVDVLYNELLVERSNYPNLDFYMYVTASPRSVKKALVMFINECVSILANYMTDDGQIKRIAKLSHIWYSILQKPETRGTVKRFILDIDTKDNSVLAQSIVRAKDLGADIIAIRETRNGRHVLCTPFDVSKFQFTETVQYKRDGLLFVESLGVNDEENSSTNGASSKR